MSTRISLFHPFFNSIAVQRLSQLPKQKQLKLKKGIQMIERIEISFIGMNLEKAINTLILNLVNLTFVLNNVVKVRSNKGLILKFVNVSF